MVHGAAAGGAAHHMDLMGLHKGPVDLTLGVLVLPDDDGVVVLPQEQILPDRRLRSTVSSNARL